jgi:hypothetical protein
MSSGNNSKPSGSAKRSVTAGNTRFNEKVDNAEAGQELVSILQRLQAMYGADLRDRSQDPPQITAAFLEGLSVGSRIALGSIEGLHGNTETSRTSKGTAPARSDKYRGEGNRRTRHTRSRSPVWGRPSYRDQRSSESRRSENRAPSQAASIIKQEVSASPPSVIRGPSVPHDSLQQSRGGVFPKDRRWDHDGYVQRYPDTREPGRYPA